MDFPLLLWDVLLYAAEKEEIKHPTLSIHREANKDWHKNSVLSD